MCNWIKFSWLYCRGKHNQFYWQSNVQHYNDNNYRKQVLELVSKILVNFKVMVKNVEILYLLHVQTVLFMVVWLLRFLLVTTAQIICSCICTLLHFAQQTWKLLLIVQLVRKCSSVSTSSWLQWVHGRSSLGIQLCRWCPLLIMRLCSLSLCIVKHCLSCGWVTVLKYVATAYSLLRDKEHSRFLPVSEKVLNNFFNFVSLVNRMTVCFYVEG